MLKNSISRNRPRICEPKCIQEAEKIVYRDPAVFVQLWQTELFNSHLSGHPRTSNLASERLLRFACSSFRKLAMRSPGKGTCKSAWDHVSAARKSGRIG